MVDVVETMDPSGPSDEELARRVQYGEVAAFTDLVRRYQAKLMRYGHRLLPRSNDVEDLVQEVFLKAFTNIQGFDANRRFSPWIYRLAHNRFLDALRAGRNEAVPFFNPDELFPHPVAPDDPATDAERARLKEQLDACLGDIDARYREPLALRYYEDLSYREIAEVLRVPIGTVGIRLQRGLVQLRRVFEAKGHKP